VTQKQVALSQERVSLRLSFDAWMVGYDVESTLRLVEPGLQCMGHTGVVMQSWHRAQL